MNLSDILQKAHDNILQVSLEPLFLEEHKDKVEQIQGTLDDNLDSQITIRHTLSKLHNLRGGITAQILRLERLLIASELDHDALLRQLFISEKGVTHVKVSPQGFKGPKRTTTPKGTTQEPKKRNRTPDLERELMALKRRLDGNPALLAALKGSIKTATSEVTPTQVAEPTSEE